MNIGIVYTLLYVFTLVASTLWLQTLGKHYSVYLLLSSSSLLAILVFNGLNLKSIYKTHAIAIKDYKSWFLMSFYLMMTWVFTYLGAVINSMIFLAVVFLANALFASLHAKKWVKLAINVIVIFLIYWDNKANGVTLVELYAIGAGLFVFLYLAKSDDFSKKHNLTPLQLLSIRFYLLFIFSISMLVFYTHPVSFSLSLVDILVLMCLAVFNQILPNFFSQSGLQHLGKTEYSFLVTLTPFLAFLIYELIYQQWDYYMCILTLLATLALNYDWIATKFKNRAMT
ncbi:MAG: hypothetical protein ACHQII_05760 [Bacteroidia bacterium]